MRGGGGIRGKRSDEDVNSSGFENAKKKMMKDDEGVQDFSARF